jgi:hypothetical protein
MNNVKDQISRMKAMMNYGLQTENKNNYSSVEYQREAADGKMYGIVREGTKFYIKSAPKKSNLIKEDFEYIGGFRNRKDNEYSSYANALKQFDLKMMTIKESHNKNGMITESWNPDKQEYLALESTEKMRKEIARQRQIMNNASLISEHKSYKPTLMEEKPKGPNTDMKNDPFQEKSGNKDADNSQNTNVSKTKGDGNERAKGKKGDEGYTKVKIDNSVASQSPKGGRMVKEEEVLGWNDNADYMDKSHGTEIGDSAPFDEKEYSETEADNGTVVEEGHGKAMYQQGDNQNSPKPGVGEIGDDAPFDKTVKEDTEKDEEEAGDETLEEAIAGFEDEFSDDEGDTEEFGAEFDTQEDGPFGEDDFSQFDDETNDDVESRISAIEDILNRIAEKMGVEGISSEESFTDDSLYDNGEEEITDTETIEEPIEDCNVYESRRRKIAMLEDRLDDFGKHPAYQKKVMELPPANQKEKEGYYDMNDDSVKSEEPFGKEIGDSAPFDIDPKEIKDAIAESLKKLFNSKKKR